MTAGSGDRIFTLDVVRGVAVMGILLMNIAAFAMPQGAYYNPRAYGTDSAIDLWAYLIEFVVFDGKMRGLFSFLFGASMLLIADRSTAAGMDAAQVHRRRMAWLFAFGLAHFILLWDGDILTLYAATGMVAFSFRHNGQRALIGFGLLFAVLGWLVLAWMPLTLLAAERAGDAQQVRDFTDGFGIPSAAVTARELADHRIGFLAGVHHRLRELPTALGNILAVGPETLGYMLLGMAAFRAGLLTGAWPRARYRRWAIVGLGVGGIGYAAIAAWMWTRDFDALSVSAAAFSLAAIPRLPMIAGWAALIASILRPDGAITARVAAAGRMAFTNYLMTSIVMTMLFEGHGLAWFGTLSRSEAYLVVGAMWALILLWSRPWLERYRFGPFEWLWRSLARWKWQPIRVEPTIAAR